MKDPRRMVITEGPWPAVHWADGRHTQSGATHITLKKFDCDDKTTRIKIYDDCVLFGHPRNAAFVRHVLVPDPQYWRKL